MLILLKIAKMLYCGSCFIVFPIIILVEAYNVHINSYTKDSSLGDILCNEGQMYLGVTRSVLKCAESCSIHLDCVSFFYNKNGTCQHHDKVILNTVLCFGLAETVYYINKDYKANTTTQFTEENSLTAETSTLLTEETSSALFAETSQTSIEDASTLMVNKTSTSLVINTTMSSTYETSSQHIDETPTSLNGETLTSQSQETSALTIKEVFTSITSETSTQLIEETSTAQMEETSTSLIEETSTSLIEETSISLIEETPTTSTSLIEETSTSLEEKSTQAVGNSPTAFNEVSTLQYDNTSSLLNEETSTPLIGETLGQVMENSSTPHIEITSTPGPTVECPVDWMPLGMGCYQITPGGSTQIWTDARDYCIAINGYLAVMETTEENQALKTYLSSIGGSDYFIGGNDLETEGIFKWNHTGILMNLPGNGGFQDWYPPNQPDNGGSGGDQNCVVFYGRGEHLWNDVTCTVARKFVCESDPI